MNGTIKEIRTRLCDNINLGSVAQLWLIDVRDVLQMQPLGWDAVWLRQLVLKPGAQLLNVLTHTLGGATWNETPADTINSTEYSVQINWGIQKNGPDLMGVMRREAHRRWVAVGQDQNGNVWITDPSGHGLRFTASWDAGPGPSTGGQVRMSLQGTQHRQSWMSDGWDSVLDGLAEIPADATVPAPNSGEYGLWKYKSVMLRVLAGRLFEFSEDVIADTETLYVNGLAQKRGLDYTIDYVTKVVNFLTDDGWDIGVVWMKAAVRLT